MNLLWPLLVAAAAFFVAARWHGRRIAALLGEEPDRPTPAHEQRDGRDFVPTAPGLLFAHHFSAIAGAGPIVGPVFAAVYGLAPVWAWILVGGIFFGAVHDFAALFVSVRERGRSMAEVARATLGTRGFALFLAFACVMLVLVTSAFLSMTAISLTSLWPLDRLALAPGQTLLRTVERADPATGAKVLCGAIGGIASTSVIVITLLAPLLGWALHRGRITLRLGAALAAGISLLSIAAGVCWPVTLAPETWMLVLAVYVAFAAGAPVWLILQPRDFINVQILYAGIAALVVGLAFAGWSGLSIGTGEGIPLWAAGTGAARNGALWPMLFITVACGAISGFHALVASGTTSKQLQREGHARWIGYNGMLLESLLAIAALLAVAATLSQTEYLQIVWPEAKGAKANPILAFSLALGLLLHKTFGLGVAYGTVFGILLVEGFVVTTLDVAVRLNRYLFEELWRVLFPSRTGGWLHHPVFNAGLAVGLMLLFAWTSAFQRLWPLFATGNQMLAAISLIAISAWLALRGRRSWFTLAPALFMLATTVGSLFVQAARFLATLAPVLERGPAALLEEPFLGAALLLGVDLLMIGLACGVVALALRLRRTISC